MILNDCVKMKFWPFFWGEVEDYSRTYINVIFLEEKYRGKNRKIVLESLGCLGRGKRRSCLRFI